MSSEDEKPRKSARILLDPPTFSVTEKMRADYLAERKAQLGAMLDSARDGVWRPVMAVANNVRGTGAMYGFPNIGAAAEALVKAVQNGDSGSIDYLNAYAGIVNESYV